MGKISLNLYTLTYKENEIPVSAKEARRQIRNFLCRVKRFCKRQGLPNLKYIAVIKATSDGHIYHQVVTDCGIDSYHIVKLWSKGFVSIMLLQFNAAGISDIANYLTIEPSIGRWSASRNLGSFDNKQRSVEDALEGFVPGGILHVRMYKQSGKSSRKKG